MTTSAEVTPGEARSVGPSVQEVLVREAQTQSIPPVLLSESPRFLGLEDLPVERYTSQAAHDLEVEKLWRKVWQMACREEDVATVGDTLVYDIAEDSIVLVRTGPETIKGYYNACLHRGTQLVAEDGNVPSLRCPFHGWTWDLDGALCSVPCEWDFPQVDRDCFQLPEVRVETWDGWVFVNMDPGAAPLSSFLGEIVGHFEHFPLKARVKAAHVVAKVPCNWKVCLEAFVESYHGSVTHPQLLLTVGDANTQYDVYGDNVNRMITLMGVPSPHLGNFDDDQAVVDSFLGDLLGMDPSTAKVGDGRTARDVISDAHRALFSEVYGVDLSGLSNAEAIDAVEYAVFPNFIPWAGDGFPIVYRYRPNGSDPNSCIVDVMFMAPLPDGVPCPAGAKPHWLDGDGREVPDWSQAPELGILGPILNQDMGNVVRIQRGLKTTRKKGVTLGAYQEVRIRHFAQTLQKYLEA